MCEKNVNTITRCYKQVSLGEKRYGISHFLNQFDVIKISRDNLGIPYVGDFYIVSDINLLSTTNENEKANNYVHLRKTIEFVIRITKINSDTNKQYTWDVDKFFIDLSKEEIETACVEFVNYTKVTRVSKIVLNPEDYVGKYVIKVLIKTKENKYVIQSISGLTIES